MDLNEIQALIKFVSKSGASEVELETKDLEEWKIMVSLKYDAMHIGNKIKCNPHTMKVVRFANDSFGFNVLAKECDTLNGKDEDEDEEEQK